MRKLLNVSILLIVFLFGVKIVNAQKYTCEDVEFHIDNNFYTPFNHEVGGMVLSWCDRQGTCDDAAYKEDTVDGHNVVTYSVYAIRETKKED